MKNIVNFDFLKIRHFDRNIGIFTIFEFFIFLQLKTGHLLVENYFRNKYRDVNFPLTVVEKISSIVTAKNAWVRVKMTQCFYEGLKIFSQAFKCTLEICTLNAFVIMVLKPKTSPSS